MNAHAHSLVDEPPPSADPIIPVLGHVPEDMAVLPIYDAGSLDRCGRVLVVDPSNVVPEPGALLVAAYSLDKGARLALVHGTKRDGSPCFLALTFVQRRGVAIPLPPNCTEFPVVLGRVVGEIVDPDLKSEALDQFDRENADEVAAEREIAEAFDAALYVELMDSAGHHAVVVETNDPEERDHLLFYEGDGPVDDHPAFYAEHQAVLDAYNAGRPFTNRRIADHCRSTGRVQRCVNGLWSDDPRMPAAILDLKSERTLRRAVR
jgi:hypothetical protein